MSFECFVQRPSFSFLEHLFPFYLHCSFSFSFLSFSLWKWAESHVLRFAGGHPLANRAYSKLQHTPGLTYDDYGAFTHWLQLRLGIIHLVVVLKHSVCHLIVGLPHCHTAPLGSYSACMCICVSVCVSAVVPWTKPEIHLSSLQAATLSLSYLWLWRISFLLKRVLVTYI